MPCARSHEWPSPVGDRPLARAISTVMQVVVRMSERAYECTRTHTCSMGLTYGFLNFSEDSDRLARTS